MRDPFKPNTNKQLVREAQFGFTVIGLLVATLIYVAWFRLSGRYDMTPQHIRDSPVAARVFPNSPNYDRESHQMVGSERSTFSPSQSAPEMLAAAPKRVMEDSRSTARSLSSMADSVDDSVTKVASMLKPTPTPPQPEHVGSLGNPATSGLGDSGFKILKQPVSVVEKASTPIQNKATQNEPPVKVPEFKPRANFSDFKPTSLPKTELPKLEKPELEIPKLEKPSGFKPPEVTSSSSGSSFVPFKASTNAFRQEPSLALPVKEKDQPKSDGEFSAGANAPVKLKLPEFPRSSETLAEPKIESPAKPSPFTLESVKPKVDSSTAPPAPQIKATEQGSVFPFQNPPARPIADIRAPMKDLREPAVVAKSKVKESEPVVQTVSFESTTWKVKKGDSFWSIAESSYGDPRFFRALYELNRNVVPGFEDLKEGVEIKVPSEAELIKKVSEFCPADAVHRNDAWRETPDDMMEGLTESCESDLDRRLYETKAGDTLFGVARRRLNQASRYVELIDLNRFRIDENVTPETELPVGTKLLLPAK